MKTTNDFSNWRIKTARDAKELIRYGFNFCRAKVKVTSSQDQEGQLIDGWVGDDASGGHIFVDKDGKVFKGDNYWVSIEELLS